MIVTGNYLDVQINYVAFWEKPPLFFWIQVLSMKIFGINEFAARFPNALIGVITVCVLFYMGNSIHQSKKFGWLWALVYLGSFLPFFYFKSGIIDPLFNLFIFLGIFQFYLFSLKLEHGILLKHVFFSAMFIGLATLTKGPVALLLFLLTAFIFMWYKKTVKAYFNWKVLGLYLITFSFFGGFWFILQFLTGNYNVLVDFIEYMIRLFKEKDAGHGGFFAYHFVVLFFGVFPASIFTIRSFKKMTLDTDSQRSFRVWMLILFWVVLILFSIVNTKIIHYSSMAYFPLTYLATLIIYQIIEGKIDYKKWMKIALSFLTVVWGGVVAAFPYLYMNRQSIIDSDIIKDPFAIANLEADINFPFYISLIGLLYIVAVIYFIWMSKNLSKSFYGLFISSLLFIELVIITIVPRIELFSQNAAITFFESKVGKDCYVDTYGYKSYAQFFYTKKQPIKKDYSLNQDKLLSTDVNLPVYIICKITKEEEFKNNYPHFSEIGSKNGFTFYYYEPDIKSGIPLN